MLTDRTTNFPNAVPLPSTGSHRDLISVTRASGKKNRAPPAGAHYLAQSRYDAPELIEHTAVVRGARGEGH